MLDMQTIDIWQQLTVVIDAAIAAVIGSIIGWERDRAGKSAGPRSSPSLQRVSITLR